MVVLSTMDSSFVPLSNHGIIIDKEEEEDEIGSFSSFSNDDDDEDEGEEISSNTPDFAEVDGPLFQMSSIFSQLPIKRGLSKHFEGKSQSFTSLSNVKSLEDLVKPERRPLIRSKQLKSSKSYGWGLDSHKVTKKSSRGNFSSLGNMKRNMVLMGNRPPSPTQRSSGNLNGHTLLFA